VSRRRPTATPLPHRPVPSPVLGPPRIAGRRWSVVNEWSVDGSGVYPLVATRRHASINAPSVSFAVSSRESDLDTRHDSVSELGREPFEGHRVPVPRGRTRRPARRSDGRTARERM